MPAVEYRKHQTLAPEDEPVDYLDERYLAAELAQSGYEEFSPTDIKYAALCLMINPNEYTSRVILASYGYHHILYGEDDAARAAVSLAIGRAARGMHTYDRYRYPLVGFLHLCYERGYRDLFAGTESAAPPPIAVHRRPGAEDVRGGGVKRESDIELEKKIGKLLSLPEGKRASFPLKQKGEDGGREPVPYFLYSMSEDELDEALRRCKQAGRPVSLEMTGYALEPRPSELEAEMLEFREWYPKHCKDKNARRNLTLFSLYWLESMNVPDILSAAGKLGIDEGLTSAKVRYVIYDKLLPAFKEFRAHRETRRREPDSR